MFWLTKAYFVTVVLKQKIISYLESLATCHDANTNLVFKNKAFRSQI